MRSFLGSFALLLAGIALPASSVAMSAPAPCSVVEGDKLPPETGGPDALCAAVERAVASAAPGVRYKAEIRVLSRARLAAVLVVDGHTLPQQNFAVMDRDLNRGAIERFAQALAAEVAKAHSR
jgi:hypothetical protein